MTTINHEYYVSLEVAKLLKEAGFDWECKMWIQWHPPVIEYGDNPGLIERDIDPKYTMPISETYPRPTLDVVQRWLREVKGYDVFVVPCNGLYFYTVRKYYHEDKVEYFDYPNKDAFDTYEKTLETGIKKCLIILLEE